MVTVSQLAAGVLAEKHGETLVKRRAVVLRDRENGARSGRDMAASLRTLSQQMVSLAEADAAVEPILQRMPVGGMVKRACDLTIALTTLILMAPIMAIIALLILVTMGRPVLFIQQRVGFSRHMFGCFKFRTMVKDANHRLADYLAHDADAARAWAETQKLKNDPRVTWLGQILRKSSLDELPQLFNILHGEMSCIGPRPIIQGELERYGLHAGDYLSAKPGLTGMWQVNGRSATSYAHRVKCDRFYVRRWSLLLDLAILFKTVPAVMKFDETA